ncbi:MAG: M16 family metallopeptidase, partial [Candidatus Rokuibacteriota bacterium]
LKDEAVRDEELQRAKNQIEAAFVFGQDSVHRRATQLAQFELIGGYTLQATYLDRIRAVTAGDLLRVARTYFPPEGKSVGVLLPRP